MCELCLLNTPLSHHDRTVATFVRFPIHKHIKGPDYYFPLQLGFSNVDLMEERFIIGIKINHSFGRFDNAFNGQHY